MNHVTNGDSAVAGAADGGAGVSMNDAGEQRTKTMGKRRKTKMRMKYRNQQLIVQLGGTDCLNHS